MKKRTVQREAICRVVENTTSHPSPEWVYEQVKHEVPGIGLATVYRNLRMLREEGRVTEVRTNENTARYDGNTETHYHFHCNRCGCIMDLDMPVDTAVEAAVAAMTGLKVTSHRMDFTGLCRKCQNGSDTAD